MPTTLREVPINGNVWLACMANGHTYLLDRLGKVGECRRPGGKSMNK